MKQMIEVIPIENLEKFCEAIKDDEYRALYLLVLFCGVGWKQIARLRWESIDYASQEITVDKGCEAEYKIVVGEDVLLALQDRQEFAKNAGINGPMAKYVFTNEKHDDFVEFNYVKKHLAEIAEKIRRFDINMKSLRRAFCVYYLVFNELNVRLLSKVIHEDLQEIIKSYVEGSTLFQADSVKRIQAYKDNNIIKQITSVQLPDPDDIIY